MKIKNKDGTVNSLPIVIIFSVVFIAAYIFIFGIDIKEEVKDVIYDDDITTKKTTEKTTIKLCNGCSIRFSDPSYDVSTNGTMDLSNYILLDKVSIRDVTFTVDNADLASIQSYSNTFRLTTGNQEGTINLTATYGDKVATATINILHPSKSDVYYKYPYYFTTIKGKINPEYDVYPIGYNVNEIAFESSTKDIVGINKKTGEVTGKKVGSTNISLSIGKNKSTTTIYVVPNLITIKVPNGNGFKVARELTPVGDDFDLQISFEDKERANYDQKDLDISFIPEGINATASTPVKASDYNSYVTHINISGAGKTTMKVSLPDGSFTYFEIKR